jgi:hypothetical protein
MKKFIIINLLVVASFSNAMEEDNGYNEIYNAQPNLLTRCTNRTIEWLEKIQKSDFSTKTNVSAMAGFAGICLLDAIYLHTGYIGFFSFGQVLLTHMNAHLLARQKEFLDDTKGFMNDTSSDISKPLDRLSGNSMPSHYYNFFPNTLVSMNALMASLCALNISVKNNEDSIPLLAALSIFYSNNTKKIYKNAEEVKKVIAMAKSKGLIQANLHND